MSKATALPLILSCSCLCLLAAPVPAQGLPPSAEAAEQALDASPRHGEYAFIDLPGGDVKMKTWVVYPERAEKAPVVVVIHEIFGLTDWIRGVADALAAEGFIAVAPDLIAGIEGAEENPREAIGRLDDPTAIARLDAALEHALALPAAGDGAGVVGFCWGGRMSFLYAAAQPKLDAAVVYYGTSPAEADTLANVKVPVLGLYGEDDARVNATVGPAQEEMKRLEKTYEVATYDGAGHGFLRQQDGRDGANRRASEQAWARTLEFLRAHTEP